VKRPRLIWLEDGESDLRELKAKTWIRKACNAEEWPFVVKEVKVPAGP
jgi:hypothetical protein